MGFRLGSFIGGVAKGATDAIEDLEKINTTQINDSVKSMYHNYQEYKKEVDKKKNEMRDVVGSLRSLQFADGPLNDQELVALASNVPMAKEIADIIKKNPERLEGLSKSFIKASDKIPEGMTINDYIDQYGKTARMNAAQLEKVASVKEDGFLNKMIYGDNVKKLRSAASRYGVSAEELFSVGAAKDAPSLPTLLQVDYAKLKERPDFKKLESDAQVAMYNALEGGTEEEKVKAIANVSRITLIKEIASKQNKTQAQIEADYANEVIALQKAGKPQEAAAKEAELRNWQKLVANPNLKEKTDADKISQANLIVAASRTMESTLKNYLPPGSFITTSNPDGTTNIEVKDLASSDKAAKGYAAGRDVLIKEMTKDGKPKSEMHKNALLSAGVQFDQDGNAVNPKVNYGGTEGAPAAPAASAPRRGGPSARPTAAIDVAAARAEANSAIAKGADANAVKARFKQQTGQDL